MHSPYLPALISQGFRFLIHLSATVLLARLVDPVAFGLVGMAMVLIRFLELFKTGGLPQVTVQRKSILPEQVSALFWVNGLLATGLFALAVILSPALGWFYKESAVTWVVVGLGLPLWISGWGLQHRALLQRDLKFGRLAVAEVVGLITGLGAALTVALRGNGLGALITYPLVTALVETALLWALSGWRPRAILRNTGIRPMLWFGGQLSAGQFLGYMSRNTDDLLIGRLLGAPVLGQYNRAYGLMVMPLTQVNGPVQSVLLPQLSRLLDQPHAFANKVYRSVFWVSLVTTPLLVFGTLFGEQFVHLLSGKGWELAATLFPLLAFAGLFQPLGSLSGTIFISQGKAKIALLWQAFSTVWLVVAFVVGISHGILGLVLAYAMAIRFQQPILLWVLCKHSPLAAGSYLRAMAPGVFLAWCVVLVVWILRGSFGF